MPKICSVAGCSNNHMKKENVSFFKFPDEKLNAERRYRWIRACGRQNPDGSQWIPTAKYIYICSEHFVNGKPNPNVDHPDYVPSLLARTPKSVLKGERKVTRFNSVRRRKLILSPNTNIENIAEEDSDADFHMLIPESDCDSPCTASQDCCASGFTEVSPENAEFYATPIPGAKFPSKDKERDMLYMEINNLREERDLLREELNKKTPRLNSELIQENDSKSKFYTGLCWAVFLRTFLFLNEGLKQSHPQSLSHQEQFFVTLVKLRQNPKFDYLADQIGVGKTTVIDIFWKWLRIINSKLGFMITWPDRETIFSTTPVAFKTNFPRLTNIIDCFEIFIENPKNLKAKAQCYSNYKKHTTVKFLVACNPRGAVIFLSKAWGGRVSDNEITRKSGYISHVLHHPGDQILADRGFLLQEDLATVCSAELILPAFTKGRKQLCAQSVEKSHQLASVRILVERVIGLMKSRFSILQGTLPLKSVNSVKTESENLDLSSVDLIVRGCAILTNLGDGIQS